MNLNELKAEIFSLIAESVFDDYEEHFTTPFNFLWDGDNSTSHKPITLDDIQCSLVSCQTKEELDELVNVGWADAEDFMLESMQELLNNNSLTLKECWHDN
jgi:hypothetical protein